MYDNSLQVLQSLLFLKTLPINQFAWKGVRRGRQKNLTIGRPSTDPSTELRHGTRAQELVERSSRPNDSVSASVYHTTAKRLFNRG